MKGPDCHNTDAGLSDQVDYPRGWLIKVAGGSGDTILNFVGLRPRARVSFSDRDGPIGIEYAVSVLCLSVVRSRDLSCSDGMVRLDQTMSE